MKVAILPKFLLALSFSTLIIFTFSCNVQQDVIVEEVANHDAVILYPSAEKDSIDFYVPYTFKISNKSNHDINSVNIITKNSIEHGYDYLYKLTNDSIFKNIPVDEDNILGGKDKNITIFFKGRALREDSVEPFIPQDFNNFSYYDIYHSSINKVDNSSKLYEKFRNITSNDSVSLTVNFKDSSVIHVWKLGEKNFKILKSGDLKNTTDIYESIFKPE